MVKLTLEQIKQQLGTNASRDGFHTFFLNNTGIKVLVAFKDQSADLNRRLIMQREIVGQYKVRMIFEAGDRVQLIRDADVNGSISMMASFTDITEYEFNGKRFTNVEPSKEELQWLPLNRNTAQGYCSQTYVDVQRIIFDDALLNFVDIPNIGLPRISFVANEKFKTSEGLAFGFILETKGYKVVVLSPKDNLDEYDAIAHVRLHNTATIKVQAHNVKDMSLIWNKIRQKLLDGNITIGNSEGNMLLPIIGDLSKLDVEIVE